MRGVLDKKQYTVWKKIIRGLPRHTIFGEGMLIEYVNELNKLIIQTCLMVCGLKNNEIGLTKNHPVVGYSHQYISNQRTNESNTLPQIPICSECVGIMSDQDWLLVYL